MTKTYKITRGVHKVQTQTQGRDCRTLCAVNIFALGHCRYEKFPEFQKSS